MKSYQADRAVEKRPEDLLGRVEFAEAIADKLHSWRENASLVVGLSGPWGSGKTSIKNFVVDALMPDGLEKRADVIQINPWELSGTHDIESHFFCNARPLSDAQSRACSGLTDRTTLENRRGCAWNRRSAYTATHPTDFKQYRRDWNYDDGASALSLRSEARDWCSGVIVRPHHAAALVSRFIHYSTSQGMASVVAFRHPYLDMKALEKFIDPAAAEIAVENLPQESLGEEEEFAANMLREAMNRRRAGKPDRGPGVGARFDDEDDEPQ